MLGCDYDLQPGCPAGVSFGLSSRRFLNEEALQSLPSPLTTEAEIESPSKGGLLLRLRTGLRP